MKERMKKVLARMFGYRFSGPILSNIAEGTHENGFTKKADAAITTRYLLVKFGSDVDHIAVCSATSDCPLGVCEDEPAAAEDVVFVKSLAIGTRTVKMVAKEAIDYGDYVYTHAEAKVQDEPAGAGTYWCVGRSLTTCTSDGDVIEVEPFSPIKFIV